MKGEKRRIALKIGYIGTNYHGFQIQPDVPTIEGEIFRALKKLGIREDIKGIKYSSSGRTDKGVHAISQVIAFDTTHSKVSPRMINSELSPDIFAFGIATPSDEFDARRDAISREYIYFMPDEGLDIEKMKEASKLFIGEHNFSNFSYGYSQSQSFCSDNPRAIRRIERIEVEKKGSFIIITIKANSFLRMMARKIVAVLKMIGNGTKDDAWIEELLKMEKRGEIEAAPASGLVLRNVSYPKGVKFIEDEYAMRRITKKIEKELFYHSTVVEVLKDMRKTFS